MPTDPPTAVSQTADKFEPDVIAVHPLDGTVYLSANNGSGLNRYAASNGASLDYLPLQAGAPGAPGASAKSARFLGLNLLVAVNQTAPSSYDTRALVVEAAERFQPNDIDRVDRRDRPVEPAKVSRPERACHRQ